MTPGVSSAVANFAGIPLTGPISPSIEAICPVPIMSCLMSILSDVESKTINKGRSAEKPDIFSPLSVAAAAPIFVIDIS